MIESLGPLERVDGRWALGDARRPGRAWVEFLPDGLHAHGRDGGVEVIPWSRIMLGIGVTLGGRYPSRGEIYCQMGWLGGMPGPFRGRGGGYLHMTLRHPYEDHLVFFDRHPRWYRMADLFALQALLRRLVEDGEVHRLADGDWLARAVPRLSGLGNWLTKAKLHRAVTEAVEADPAAEGAG